MKSPVKACVEVLSELHYCVLYCSSPSYYHFQLWSLFPVLDNYNLQILFLANPDTYLDMKGLKLLHAYTDETTNKVISES